MQLNANQAFYLLVNNKSIASMSTSMAEIYRDDKVKIKKQNLIKFLFCILLRMMMVFFI